MIILSHKQKVDSLKVWISNLQEFQLDSFFDSKSLGRAYGYIGALQDIHIDENKISAKILSTSEYQVSISDHGSEVLSSCTCPMNSSCKHIAALLLSQMNIRY